MRPLQDRLHPEKCRRPIASGRLPVWVAQLIVAGTWGAALWLALRWFPGSNVPMIFVVFIAFNLFYSLYARHVPYLDIVSNASTWGLR
jgi:decaprenyl-phosphate phosphoribosyltransferase